MSRTNTVESLKKREKKQKKFLTDLKIRSLRKVNRRGKVVGQKNKMSTFKAQSSYDIAKQQSNSKTGMSNLGSDYKKQEKKFSEKATEDSANRNKSKYPLMGTYKNKDGKSYADEKKKKKSKSDLKAGKYFTWKGKRYKAGSVTARKAENQMRARKRAQEAAKKRKENK